PAKQQNLDVEKLQQKWNAEVESQAIWPLLLDSLAEFVARLNLDDSQIEELTHALRSLLNQRSKAVAAIAAKNQWLYTLSPTTDGQIKGQWLLIPANACVHEIPRIPPLVRIAALLPGLA